MSELGLIKIGRGARAGKFGKKVIQPQEESFHPSRPHLDRAYRRKSMSSRQHRAEGRTIPFEIQMNQGGYLR